MATVVSIVSERDLSIHMCHENRVSLCCKAITSLERSFKTAVVK